MDELTSSVYLLEPLDERNPKKKLVYADSTANARKAASISNDTIDRIFADRDLSTCVKIEPDITIIKATPKNIKIKYNDSIYDLTKDEARDVTIETFA